MFKMLDCFNVKFLPILLLVMIAMLPISAQAQWEASGNDAIFSMHLPQAKKPNTYAMLIISFDSNWSCIPVASVMMVNGKKLGTVRSESQIRTEADQLSIIIDGRKFTSETNETMYSNGIEMAMFVPKDIIEALLDNPKSIHAKLGAGFGGFDFSDARVGFKEAGAKAYANCK